MTSEILKVNKIIDVVDKGVTFPIRCSLKNGKEAYVKYIKNRAGTMTLINEFIGYNIAKKLNFTIPRFGLCLLEKDVIESFGNQEIIDFDNSGVSFYTESIANAGIINSSISKKNINNELEKCILIDYILNNTDRHIGNVLYSFNEHRVYFIDFSHIISSDNKRLLNVNITNDTSKNYILSFYSIVNNIKTDEKNVYDILTDLMGFRLERLKKEAGSIKLKITNKFLDEIMRSIPPQWASNNLSNIISNYFVILRERIKYVDDIVEIFIEKLKEKS